MVLCVLRQHGFCRLDPDAFHEVRRLAHSLCAVVTIGINVCGLVTVWLTAENVDRVGRVPWFAYSFLLGAVGAAGGAIAIGVFHAHGWLPLLVFGLIMNAKCHQRDRRLPVYARTLSDSDARPRNGDREQHEPCCEHNRASGGRLSDGDELRHGECLWHVRMVSSSAICSCSSSASKRRAAFLKKSHRSHPSTGDGVATRRSSARNGARARCRRIRKWVEKEWLATRSRSTCERSSTTMATRSYEPHTTRVRQDQSSGRTDHVANSSGEKAYARPPLCAPLVARCATVPLVPIGAAAQTAPLPHIRIAITSADNFAEAYFAQDAAFSPKAAWTSRSSA